MIAYLNKCVASFYEAVKSNDQARLFCEIAIVTFNGEVKVEEEFSSVDQKIAPTYVAEGGTALAHAVQKSLAVGNDEDEKKYHEIMDVLNGFCLKPNAIHLKNLKFEEFY